MDFKYIIGFMVGVIFCIIFMFVLNEITYTDPEPVKTTYIELRNESKRMDAYFYDIFHYEVPVGFVLLPFRADTLIVISQE